MQKFDPPGVLKISKSHGTHCCSGGESLSCERILDRGYGKPPQHQHITGEDGPRFVALLPEPCKTVEEWEASLGPQADCGSSTSVRLRGQEEPPTQKLLPK